MRTCIKCGCYIPDNWNTCPACSHESKESVNNQKIYSAYIVTIGYYDGTIGESIFMKYENAFNYAHRMYHSSLANYVEIWDGNKKERIEIF